MIQLAMKPSHYQYVLSAVCAGIQALNYFLQNMYVYLNPLPSSPQKRDVSQQNSQEKHGAVLFWLISRYNVGLIHFLRPVPVEVLLRRPVLTETCN